jgi:hypothetical protein
MKDRSKKSPSRISKATRSTISSPGSACGVTPLERLDGQMILPCGVDPVPAKVSVQAGTGKALAITVTFGLHGSGSLESFALTSFLANKYREKTDSRGSTLFRLIWKTRVTPSGRSIPAQRASARRTSASDCTSWPTATGRDDRGGKPQRGQGRTFCLNDKALLTGWPTPNAGPQNDSDTTWKQRRAVSREKYHNNGFGLTVGQTAQLAGWPTPNCDDPNNGTRASGEYNSLTRAASWATPRAEDSEYIGAHRGKPDGLHNQVAAWTTPASRDWKDTPGMTQQTEDRKRLDQLPRLAHLSGTELGSTAAPTDASGSFLLNPRFSLWLLGLPDEWASCAERGMRAVRRKPSRSSKHTSK